MPVDVEVVVQVPDMAAAVWLVNQVAGFDQVQLRTVRAYHSVEFRFTGEDVHDG